MGKLALTNIGRLDRKTLSKLVADSKRAIEGFDFDPGWGASTATVKHRLGITPKTVIIQVSADRKGDGYTQIMPTLSQLSTAKIPSAVGMDPLSAEYGQRQVDRFQQQTQPQFNEGLRSLRSYIRSSRGLADSGIEAGEVGGLVQGQANKVNDFAGRIGEQQVALSDAERVRQQARKWQKEDQQMAMDTEERQASRKAQEQQDALWGNIIGSGAEWVANMYAPGAGTLARKGIENAQQQNKPAQRPVRPPSNEPDYSYAYPQVALPYNENRRY